MKELNNELLDEKNLLNNSDTLTDVKIKSQEILTEVTSIANEELKTGQIIKTPSPEELLSRASMAFIKDLKHLEEVFNKLSVRGKTRAILSILNLPPDKVPVKLQDKNEYLAFALGQNILNNRFLITQHHVNQEIARIREEKE